MMHSPTKSHHKKTRKNTFSQVAIAHNDVGSFQEGYFVMPEDTDSIKSKSLKVDRSPSRRKHVDSPLSPPKNDKKTHLVDTPKKDKADVLMTLGSISVDSKPKAPQYIEHYKGLSNSTTVKDVLSSSPPISERWAGPAFGNAPHPSALPLPEWTEISFQKPAHQPQSLPFPAAYLSTYALPQYDMSFSATPAPSFHSSPAATSLTQLSVDLRRMLNITSPIINNDPILVTANSY